MNEKLTAYVLNELPPDERAELEAQMKTDPALREQAEEMKSFCAMLSQQVAGDESPALTPQQRVSVMRAFTGTRFAHGPRSTLLAKSLSWLDAGGGRSAPVSRTIPPPGTLLSTSRRPGVVTGQVTSAMLARSVDT